MSTGKTTPHRTAAWLWLVLSLVLAIAAEIWAVVTKSRFGPNWIGHGLFRGVLFCLPSTAPRNLETYVKRSRQLIRRHPCYG